MVNKDGCLGRWFADFSATTEQHFEKLERSKSSTSFSKFVFFGSIRQQDVCPGLWFPDIFSFISLDCYRFWRHLKRSKSLTTSTRSLFFKSIRQQRWLSWPLISRHIFDFSAISKRNFEKLEGSNSSTSSAKFFFRASVSTKLAAWHRKRTFGICFLCEESSSGCWWDIEVSICWQSLPSHSCPPPHTHTHSRVTPPRERQPSPRKT